MKKYGSNEVEEDESDDDMWVDLDKGEDGNLAEAEDSEKDSESDSDSDRDVYTF